MGLAQYEASGRLAIISRSVRVVANSSPKREHERCWRRDYPTAGSTQALCGFDQKLRRLGNAVQPQP
jgi:hypothetical protein